MRGIRWFYAAVFLLIFSFIVANSVRLFTSSTIQGRNVQNTFIKKINTTRDYMHAIKKQSFQNAANITDNAISEGISLLNFSNAKLDFWSNNEVPFSFVSFDTITDGSVIDLANSKFFILIDSSLGYKTVGLIQLANTYPYENKFLVNGLRSDFSRFKALVIVNELDADSYSVFDENDKYAFSVKFDNGEDVTSVWSEALSTMFLLLGFVFLFISIRNYIALRVAERKCKSIAIVLFSLLVFRYLLLITNALDDNYYFFDPFIYATKWAPTFGDLILNTIYFLFLIYLVFRFVKIPAKYMNNSFNRNAWVGIVNVFIIFILWYVHKSSLSVITDSSLTLVVYNISEISVSTVIAYAVFAAHFFALYLLIVWAYVNLKSIENYKQILNFSTLLLVLYAISFAFDYSLDIFSVTFALILYALTPLILNKLYSRTIFSSLVLLIFLFTVYIIVFSVNYAGQKEQRINQSFIENLANEHDPVAEYLLENIGVGMKEDKAIIDMLEAENFDIRNLETLETYLSNNYFKGYLKKYNLIVTLCRPQDSVSFNLAENNWHHCYEYFEQHINDFGYTVDQTPFYYIKSLSGLISYFGWITYEVFDYQEVSILLQLDSKLNLTSQPLGYPELLLDKKVKKSTYFDKFSYAKYNRGHLISHNGNYDYSLDSEFYTREDKGANYLLFLNDYKHVVHRPDDENLIVVSEKRLRAIDYVVIFSYVFVFYYLMAFATIFLLVSKYRHLSFKDSLRNKIQFSVILILIASLILIAGSTIWFNIRKYNQTQFRIIKEKIQSVFVELEHKLSYEETLTADWSTEKYESLDQLLIKFSDVFYSDINLYSPEGILIATSRPEIFQLGLQNHVMEPLAYYKMNNEKLAKYVHKERINNLKYLSAYIPFANTQGELLAYLNLPYFTKQQELQEDITTLTVAIVNIYVLLILLTIVIAVFIANQITKPLEMLQSRFRRFKLGEKYEVINYTRNDEIGKLVFEYNRMVIELEESVGLLAKSERESAWREMAKQVAHEIKNPLTPMRLSVQQLQRSWDDKKENFENYLSRVTQTLIEQIDNLSTIASEFSNFAKMPVAQIEKVNLADVLERTVELFKSNEKVEVTASISVTNIFIKADSEQLNRVFINIIKNGIQAIPEERKGKINASLTLVGENAIVEFSDNGKGISKDVRDKLFMPNFTTKTSGMGLGLSIVKNTLEQIDGNIEFSTELGIGTTFKITVPVVNK